MNPNTQQAFQQAVQLFQQNQPAQAKQLCEQICQQDDSSLQVWCFLAFLNIRLGLHEQALQCSQRATALDANSPEAHYNLGVALFNLNRLDESQKQFEHLMAIRPDYTVGKVFLGRVYLYQQDFARAIEIYESCRKQMPGDANLLCQLADAYERSHRIEEAQSAVDQALAIQPNNVELNVIASRLERRSKSYENAAQRMQRMVAFAQAPHEQEMVFNELGMVLDKQGKYDAAFDAFEKCNQAITVRNGGRFDYRQYIAFIQQHHEAIVPATVSQWHQYEAADDERASPTFLVGFPRSGTTLMEQVLSAHSQMTTSNELMTMQVLASKVTGMVPGQAAQYPFGLELLGANEIRQLRDEYWSYVEQNTGGPVETHHYLDKMPTNIILLGLARLIFPDAKIILALRDPRDACLSSYFQAFRSDMAMSATETLQGTAELYSAQMETWKHYIDVLDLDCYVCRYETLTSDFENVARELIAATGLDWEDSVLEFNSKHLQRNVITPSYQDVATEVNTRAVGRWKNYETRLQAMLPALQTYVDYFGYSDGVDSDSV